MLPSAEYKGFSASPAGECKALVRQDCLHQCTHILLDKTHNYSMLHAPYHAIKVLPQATASRLLYLTKFLICIEPEITQAVLDPLYFTVTLFPPPTQPLPPCSSDSPSSLSIASSPLASSRPVVWPTIDTAYPSLPFQISSKARPRDKPDCNTCLGSGSTGN